MAFEVRVTGFRRRAECQLSGRSGCDCFVAVLPGASGPITVSATALATWVKNRSAALAGRSEGAAVERPKATDSGRASSG